MELTIPFEAGMAEAVERKRAKYEELLGACAPSQRTAHLIIEVGSRSFINTPSLGWALSPPDTIKKTGAQRTQEADHEKVHYSLP